VAAGWLDSNISVVNVKKCGYVVNRKDSISMGVVATQPSVMADRIFKILLWIIRKDTDAEGKRQFKQNQI